MRILLLSALLTFLTGSSCLDNQMILPGQVGQITDAVSVSCKPYPATQDSHACVFLANAYLGSTKVFDATDNQFVLAPIAYFPLVIRSGERPEFLASWQSRVWTMDPATRAIYEIPSTLISPFENAAIGFTFTPTGFVVATYQNSPWAFVIGNGAQLQAISLDTNAPAVTVNLSAEPSLITTDGTYILLASGSQLMTLELAAMPTPTVKSVTLAAGINALTVAQGQALLGLSNQSLVMVNIATQTPQGTQTIGANAMAVYLPASLPGTPQTCCNGVTNWVSALLTNGTILYQSYAGGAFTQASQTVDIHDKLGIASYALSNPTKLIGVQVDRPSQDGLACSRRMVLVYSGLILHTCEGGGGNLKVVSQSDL